MGELIVGKHTYHCGLIRRGYGNTIKIGSYCSIAEEVIMDGGFNHKTESISTYPFNRLPQLTHLESNIKIKGDIEIGSDVWIGEGAVIMSGTKIAHGAVIGMRCIVSKDVNPYEIVVGAPQKVLRKRFSEEQIEKLLKLKWWDFEDDEIIKIAPLLQSNNIEELLRKYNL